MVTAARTNRMKQAAGAAATVISSRLADWFMPARRDWNTMGRPIPAWFRRRLAAIDPQLVLQYMPPRSVDPKGVSDDQFPAGVWVICTRLGRTRWLAKQWVYSLTDDQGHYCPPDGKLVRLLRVAVRASRRDQRGQLSDWFDRHLDALGKERSDTARQQRMIEIAEMMRKSGMTSANGPRVFVGHAIGG